MPSQRLVDRTPRAPARHGAKRSGLLLLATATLLLIPALAYADVPVATISGPVSVAEGTIGNNNPAVYTVTLTGGEGSVAIVVDYTVTGTVSDGDYADAGEGKLTIAATQDTGVITIGVAGDDIDEVPETLIVTLTKIATEAGMAAIGSPDSVTTTVLPAATNILEFNTASRNVSQAEDTGLQFTATLTTDVDVVVHYDIIPGTASRTDYDSASGTFTISSNNNNEGSFTITPVDDNLAEDAETFTVRLRLVSPPANVALGIATATGTITDDDTIAATVTANQTTIVEGSVATFTVDLGDGDVAGSEDVVVTYHTDPDTDPNTDDAEPNDFEAPEGTLIIPAGQTMGTIAITTNRDDLQEGVETLRVTLRAATSDAGMVDVTDVDENATATTGIGDRESTVLVSVADATTTEGEEAKLLVKLSGKVSGAVRVTYTLADDTADSGDYTHTPQPVEIPAGMTTGTITVSTTEDMDAENAETFTVTLGIQTSPEGVEVALGDATATATINDDDPLTVTVTGAGRVREGDEATFTVDLNGGMGITPITVDYTVGGTATEGTDYVEPAGTLVINPTDSLTNVSAMIPIPTIQDSEADESLVVTLTGVRTKTGRVTLGTPHIARTTLVSQDTVIISVADALVVEGQSASFVVSVSGVRSGTVKLRYETAPGTATDDYTAASDTRDIDIGEDPPNLPITVAITDDSRAEGDETFTLDLSLVNAPDNVVLAATSAKATISDDPGDALSVRVDSEEGSVEEGSDANFPVTLSGTSTADVIVKYTVAGSDADGADAAEKEDYEVPGDSVTIPAGTNTATITIPIVADDLLEPNEKLQVTLMSPTTTKGAFADPPVTEDRATTDIIPQAQDAVTVSLAQTAVTVTEGSRASFPVELSGKVASDVTVTYAITVPGTDDAHIFADTNDYSTDDPAQVVIKAGETRAVIEVNTTSDTAAENTETFTLTLTLSSPPAGVSLGTPRATGTITDNDPINVTVEGPDRVVAGGSGSYRFRLTGDTTASEAITVSYTTNGTPPTTDTTIPIPANNAVSASLSVGTGSLTTGSLVVRVTDVTTDAGRVASGVGRSKSTQIRPTGTVLVSIAETSVDVEAEEGDDASFTVNAPGSPNGTTVQYQVSAGSASTADFTTPSERTLTVPGTIMVPVVDDDVAEGAETFRVTLSNPRPPAGSTVGVGLGTTTGTATIPENDELTAEVSSQDTTVLEGESATFVVRLENAANQLSTSSASVEIDYTVAGATVNGLATDVAENEDFSPEKGRLTIPAGRSTGTIQIEAVDDDILEPNEGLQVTLSNPSPSNVFSEVGNGVGDSAQTVIGANGSTVTVSLATTAVTVTEGSRASFPVELSGKVASDVTVTYAITVPGTDDAHIFADTNDYSTDDPAQVVIKAGETRAVIEVNTTSDTAAENTETFTLTLTLSSPPAGVSLGTPRATGTITDNDPINVTVEGPDRVVAGGSGSYRFRLTGDTTASEAITVSYTTNGTPPTTDTTIPIPANNAVSASLSVGTGSLTTGSLVVRVTDVTTDAGRVASGVGRSKSTQIRPTGTVLVSIAETSVDVEAEEGDDASFTVNAPGSPNGTTVQYQVSAGSASTADFTTPSERTLTVPGTIMVPVVDDDVAEGAETFRVTLSNPRPPAGSTVGVGLGTTTGTATIPENDELTAEVSSQDTTVLEGESATFVVRLENAANQLSTSSASVEIDYTVAGATVNGLATDVAENEDFSPEKGRLTIPAGRSTGTIQIEAVDDDILEPNEGLQVTLSNPSPSNVFSEVGNGVGDSAQTVIGASDSPARVSVADVTVDEGETAMIEVKLSKEVSSQVSVPFGLDPPPDRDYGGPTPTSPLVFMPGDTAKTIEVKTTPDTLAEDEETFTVTLRQPSPAVTGVSLGRNEATVTITDDALRATIEGPASVNEGDDAVYTVTVTGGTFGTGEDDQVTVTWSTEDSSATPIDDFMPASGPLVIGAEEPSATFTIRTVDDEIPELGEIIEVSLTAQTVVDGETESVRTGAPARTMIVDDDGAVQVRIERDPDQPVVAEGQPATFTVGLTGAVAEALAVRYTTGAAGDTAEAGTDYVPAESGATVEIRAGEMSATISVRTLIDPDELDDEFFTVTLLEDDLPEDVAIDAQAGTATVTITDHEISASVSVDQDPVTEGSPVVFTVALTVGGTAAGDRNRSGVEVQYAVGGDVTPQDYSEASTGTLTIATGQSEATITITTIDDDVLDPGETLTLSLTGATSLQNQGLAIVHPREGAASTMVVDGGSVTWSVADITVDEGDPAIFTVTLNGVVQDDVTLTYETTTDGSATAGSDYAAASSRLTVTGGNTSATFTVGTVDDPDPEPTETFMVRLELVDAPDGVEPLRREATASITDDDLALRPVADVTVTEGQVESIMLVPERPLLETVLLGYSIISGNATEGQDYSIVLPDGTPLPADVAFPVPPNTPAAVIAVSAMSDTLSEGDESFTVDVWTESSTGQRTSLLEVMVTIKDANELVASVTVPESVDEGETARFTVTLGGGTSTANVVVSYTVGGTAKAPDDYTAPSPMMVTIGAGQASGTIAIQTKTDDEIEPDETLVVTLDEVETANGGKARVGSPSSATTAIQDVVYHSINRVNQALLPSVARASAASALEAVSWRMAEAAQGDPPAATADLSGLTGLYRALQANEQALQDGSYDLARVLGGSSFLVPLSSHDQDSGSGVGVAVWGGGDFRSIGGGEEGAVDWDGSAWSARLGADLRFIDSLLTGLAISWTSGALDYEDGTPRDDREGTYASWLISAHPYVGWTTPDFGLWATGGFGWGGVTIDDSEADAQEADATQWSVGAGGSVTLLSTDWFIAGGTTAVKLKAEGFLAGATVAENEAKTIAELTVGVNQARAAIEASHAQHFAGGGSLRPSLEIGGRFDGGDGETGAGLEVGGGLTYADPGSGLTVAAIGRALVVRDGNYSEWGLSGLIQLDPNAAGHGLMMSVRPTFGVTASGVSGLWEHGTLDLLSGGDVAGGRVEAEIGYGLPAFGTAGVLTPYAGASLTDAGTHSLSLGGRLELGPAFDLTLELERSDSADPDTAAEHDITLEGSFSW